MWIIVLNFMMIGRNVAEIWPIFDFQLKMAVVRHLGFFKVENFNFWFGSEARFEGPICVIVAM